MTYSLLDLFYIPDIHIVDVGASPLEGEAIYKPIIDRGCYRLTGFEPDPRMYSLLKSDERNTYLPYALGDGRIGLLNLFDFPGMNSFLEPEPAVLDTVLGGGHFGRVIGQIEMQTNRLDDIEMPPVDFLKLDIQGYELLVLQNGLDKLRQTLVIHIEINFVQFYKNQPLFGDYDVFLRKQGFMFHKFSEVHQTQSQMYWTDAVYVRSFLNYDALKPSELLKSARIMHDIYKSYDIVDLLLKAYDERMKTNTREQYQERQKGEK